MIDVAAHALLLVALILALVSLFPSPVQSILRTVALVIVILVLLCAFPWPLHLPALIRIH